MEDDREMIAQIVHHFLSKEFDHDAHHKDKIQQELEDI